MLFGLAIIMMRQMDLLLFLCVTPLDVDFESNEMKMREFKN